MQAIATGADAPNPFDPARLRISQDFDSQLNVKKHMLTVPVRKPSKESFVRTHPDDEYRLQTGVIELKEDREIYLVDPVLWPDLHGAESTFSPRILCLTVSRQNVIFLWPLRMPGANGRQDLWSATALEAAELAKDHWVRIQANMSLGAYDVFEAPQGLPEPKWPDMPMSKILEVAFRDRFITTLDHPVLKQLRGEA